MSDMAVPIDMNTITESKRSNEDSSLSASLDDTSEYTESEVSVKKTVSEMKVPASFLTKTAGLMVLYTLFFLGMSLFIVFNLIRAKLWYRSMNLRSTVWVFFIFAIIFKLIGSFANRFLKKIQGLLFILDCIFSAFAFFGLYWHFETINSNAYEYNGHYVIIYGVCFFSTSMGFLFSTLIRLRRTPYSVMTGIVIMSIFTIITLSIIKAVWPVHNMKFYKYFTVWFWMLILQIYVAFNSKFILEKRAKKLYAKDFIHVFFAYNTDWFSFFWVDVFKTIMAKKKSKKKLKKRKRNKSKKSEIVEMENESDQS